MKQHKRKLKRNARGRPRLRHKGQLIVMRLPPNELKALDRWIKADGALLSRQQAIRRILSVALGKATQKASRRRQFLLRFLSDRGGAAAVRFSVIR